MKSSVDFRGEIKLEIFDWWYTWWQARRKSYDEQGLEDVERLRRTEHLRRKWVR